jgi:hypothetical protein
MINRRAMFSAFLLAGCLTVAAYGQPGLLGGAGTSSRDGWKFSVSYVVEPPLLPDQHLSVKGQTDVMHTEAKDGRPVIFHRFLTDPAAKTYCGYDVEVEPLDKPGSARLRFKPFSLRADQLPKEYHAAGFRALDSPQFPAETFQSGQTIAVDVLANPATGQKVVDYIEVSYEPIRIASKAEPRDFQVADVILHIVAPSLRLNDAAVPPAIVAAQVIARKLVWLSVPGRGRFLLSLSPHAGYPFQKAGVANGFGLSWAWNGDRYEWRTREFVTESSGAWNLYVLAAPQTTAEANAQGFSFGAVNSVEEFFSQGQ